MFNVNLQLFPQCEHQGSLKHAWVRRPRSFWYIFVQFGLRPYNFCSYAGSSHELFCNSACLYLKQFGKIGYFQNKKKCNISYIHNLKQSTKKKTDNNNSSKIYLSILHLILLRSISVAFPFSTESTVDLYVLRGWAVRNPSEPMLNAITGGMLC